MGLKTIHKSQIITSGEIGAGTAKAKTKWERGISWVLTSWKRDLSSWPYQRS
jgi:hypothetical protein